MATDLNEFFAERPGKPTPSPAPEPSGPTGGPGTDINSFLSSQPKPPTLKDTIKAKAAPVLEKIRDVGTRSDLAGLKPFYDDALKWSNQYLDSLKEDVKAYPEGTGRQVLQSLKTVNDALGAISTPIMSPLYTGFINPIKQNIAKLGELVQKHASAEVYDAQAKREGQRGQQYPAGIDWKIHTADVQRTVTDLQDQFEAATNAALMFVGARKTPKLLERPLADARVALRDLQSAVTPAEPKLVPISVSLDKTMGFQKVSENVGKALNALPAGTVIPVKQLLNNMLPHTEGYAKEFLERLLEHVDPDIPIAFKQQAGTHPDTLGVHIPADKRIEIKLGEPDIVQTTLHEIVHSATVNMLDTLLEADLKQGAASAGRALTDIEKVAIANKPSSPLLKELDQILAEARVRAQKAGRAGEFYGLKAAELKPGDAIDLSHSLMTPRYEFIAEIFTNPRLQEFLANSEKYASAGYKFKNMLNQLGILIGRHLGLEHPQATQLLNQSLRVGSQLIKLQSTEKPPSGRSLVEILGRLPDGQTITRGDIQQATLENPKLRDSRGVEKAKTTLSISVEQILRTFSPESLGKGAKLAAAAIASRITEQMQKESMWRYGSKTRLNFWRARPDFTKEFIDRFEKGENFSDPALQKLAAKYRAWAQDLFEHDKKLGFDYEPREHYLPHIFDDPEGVASYFSRKYGGKWGDPGFIKDRAFDLYKEAVAAGFRPRFDNPEDIMLARQHASDIAAMHVGIMNDLASYGLATRKIVGGEKIVKTLDAEGKVSWKIEKTEGTKQPPNTVRWRAPNGDVFWVDSQADAVLQNAFKSNSAWEDKGLGGTAFRGMMALKNSLVPIRLALSLFHPLHVMGIDMAANWTRATTGLLSGTTSPAKFLGQILTSGFSSIHEMPVIRRAGAPGWRVMNAWRGKIAKEALTPNDAKALQTLIEMGLSPEMSSQYRTNARQNFMNALRDAAADFRRIKPVSGVGDLAKATWHAPWALLSAMSKPIFEEWIPSLKAASALKDAKNLLERNPELAENDAARHLAMRRLGKSVENRYGEMNYSTLFWKRWMKDIAVLDTLSLGWQLGFIREYGGGALDLGQWSKSGDKLQKIREGQLDRAIFVGAYTTLGAGVAGLMTWSMTGEQPSSLLDYISPRTGEKNPDGSDQRVSTMFYSREFAALYKHVQNEGLVPGVSQLVLNKGSGLFGLMHEWATGVNGFGQEIRDPAGDTFQKVEQTLAYSLSDLEPISMKAMQENLTDRPVKSGVLSALGFTPAPKYLTESKTEALIKDDFRNYVAAKMTPFEKAEYSKEFTQLRDAYQTGSEKYGDMLDKLTEKYELSGKDQRRIIRSLNSDLPGTVRMFMRLDWQQQRKVLDQATPEEVDLLLPHSNKEHVRNVWTPPEQR